jgi:hypothetical protein
VLNRSKGNASLNAKSKLRIIRSYGTCDVIYDPESKEYVARFETRSVEAAVDRYGEHDEAIDLVYKYLLYVLWFGGVKSSPC